jgi:hypothetical protein
MKTSDNENVVHVCCSCRETLEGLIQRCEEIVARTKEIVETAFATQRKKEKALLRNVRFALKIQKPFMRKFESCLHDRGRKIVMLFVDLDNVPKFSRKFSSHMITNTPFETFVICSAKRKFCELDSLLESKANCHFYLAEASKDAADAVLTSAMAKFDSLLAVADRQTDAQFVVVSSDRIFEQVSCFRGLCLNTDTGTFINCVSRFVGT